MRNFLVLLPFAVLVAYLAVAVGVARRMMRGGEGFRARVRAVVSLGAGEFLRQTWRALLLLLVALVILVSSVSSYAYYCAYQAAPNCGPSEGSECRATLELHVRRVDIQSTRSGDETIVSFVGSDSSATFSSDEVPPGAVPEGTTVVAEVWRDQVTALTIAGVRHQSFATQSNSWIGIAAGLALLLLASTWMFVDLAIESVQDVRGLRGDFVSPVTRRHALYVLLPMYAGLLVLFGFAYVAIAFRQYGTANALAAIWAIGSFLILPPLILVFVAWFYRAYFNVGALGFHVKHSGWFVTTALLVPPFSLYIPYRLLREMVVRINPPVSQLMLKNWWACAIGWLGLTIVGLSIGSPDPSDASLPNEASNAMLIGSVVVGLFGIWLTLRLVRAIDATEEAIVTGART